MTYKFNPTNPSLQEPLVDPKTGILTSSWRNYFQHQINQPQIITQPVPTASPMSFTMSTDGQLVVVGGNVSLIQFSRGRVTFTTGLTSGIIPGSMGDIVILTYTVAPTLYFVPR